mmetsp:Transcript_16975/g.34961  ORF Transcript_16975/g.34961 Transcript_16975/m.34961 type:complete len:217 (+) Transcript_16975:2949-3599(+)
MVTVAVVIVNICCRIGEHRSAVIITVVFVAIAFIIVVVVVVATTRIISMIHGVSSCLESRFVEHHIGGSASRGDVQRPGLEFVIVWMAWSLVLVLIWMLRWRHFDCIVVDGVVVVVAVVCKGVGSWSRHRQKGSNDRDKGSNRGGIETRNHARVYQYRERIDSRSVCVCVRVALCAVRGSSSTSGSTNCGLVAFLAATDKPRSFSPSLVCRCCFGV